MSGDRALSSAVDEEDILDGVLDREERGRGGGEDLVFGVLERAADLLLDREEDTFPGVERVLWRPRAGWLLEDAGMARRGGGD